MTLGDLIRQHHEPLGRWDRETFDGWLAWNVHNGFVMRAIGDHDEIVGVSVVRPVMEAEHATANRYTFDPEGSVLFIDLLICLHPSAMQAIGFGVLKRFGMRETVAWRRPPFHVTKTHSTARLRRHLFRKTRV
jgi:hypothetical protein